MDVTDAGMVNVPVKPVQPLKALVPMEVTEFPMVRLVKVVFPLNDEYVYVTFLPKYKVSMGQL